MRNSTTTCVIISYDLRGNDYGLKGAAEMESVI